MCDVKGTTRFLVRHQGKPSDCRWYDYKIFDFVSNQLLFESHEEPPERKKLKLKDLLPGKVISKIKILSVSGKEHIVIQKRVSLSVPFFSLGHDKYIILSDNNQILGVLKPCRFINGGLRLNVYDSNRRCVLQVKRGLLGSDWSFFAGKAQVGHLKDQQKSIKERPRKKVDDYLLDISGPAKQGDRLTKLILGVIVVCKHGFSPMAWV